MTQDNQALRALGANLPINEDQWKNVKTPEDILNAFYESGNYYPGIYVNELMKITGLKKHNIYSRYRKLHKNAREAGKMVPRPRKGTRFNAEQRQILSQEYQKNPYPSSQKIVELSVLTRLSSEQVYRWFGKKRHEAKLQQERNKRQELPNEAEALEQGGNEDNQD